MAVRQSKTAPIGRLKFNSIDDYHASCAPETQLLLDKMRKAIHQAAPKAVETISYGIPCFKMNKDLVYYAGYAKHIGFYPTSKPIEVFKEELLPYKTSRGAVQFPLDKPLPLTLIKEIVRYRVKEDSKSLVHAKTQSKQRRKE